MATLTYSHFGNPTRSYYRARSTVVNKKARKWLFLPSVVHKYTSNARECQSSGRGARRLEAAH